MTFDLVYQVRARTRSVQLDKASLAALASNKPEPTPRKSSLPTGHENLAPQSLQPVDQNPVRLVRSMFDVVAPQLDPVKCLNLDDLHQSLREKSPVKEKIKPPKRQTRRVSETQRPARPASRGLTRTHKKPSDISKAHQSGEGAAGVSSQHFLPRPSIIYIDPYYTSMS